MAKANQKVESAGDMLARIGTDGKLWGDEFGNQFVGRIVKIDAADDDDLAVNGGDLTGWFANAIEAGRSAGLATAGDDPAYFGQARALLEELGYGDGGPEDANSVEKVFFALRGVHATIGELSDAIVDLGLVAENEAFSPVGLAIEKLGQFSAQVNALTAENEKLIKALDGAKGQIKAFRKAQPPKMRKCGLLKDVFSSDDFAALIGSEPIEIVFSDGKNEIRGLDPLVVAGAGAWVKHTEGKWLLKQKFTLQGPAIGEAPNRVVGVGLFVGGDQFAWAEFFEPLILQPGERVELVDHIIV